MSRLLGVGLVALVAQFSCAPSSGSSDPAELEPSDQPAPVTAPMELSQDDLAAEPPETPSGGWIGQLEIAQFRRHDGCDDPAGLLETWLILRVAGRPYPLKIGSAAQLERVQADVANPRPKPFAMAGTTTPPAILTRADGARLGLAPGDQVRLQAVAAPLLFSGGAGMMPFYGLFADRVDRLGP